MFSNQTVLTYNPYKYQYPNDGVVKFSKIKSIRADENNFFLESEEQIDDFSQDTKPWNQKNLI